MAYLAEQRRSLNVPALGCVEIRRDSSGGATSLGEGIYFQCLPCGDELSENPERSLFECGSCGYTMTGGEAKELAADYVRALTSVFEIRTEERKKRGIRWLLLILFGSRKKPRALTS